MNDIKLNTAEMQQKSVTKEISKIILILIIPIAFVSYRYFTAPPHGFCVAQNRIVPDDVFIGKAVASHLNEKDINPKEYKYYNPMVFHDSDFKIVTCCAIRRADKVDFLSKMFHSQNGVWVMMAVEVSQEARNRTGDRRKYVDHGYFFDNCANFLPTHLASASGAVFLPYDHNGDSPPTVNPYFFKYYVKWSI